MASPRKRFFKKTPHSSFSCLKDILQAHFCPETFFKGRQIKQKTCATFINPKKVPGEHSPLVTASSLSSCCLDDEQYDAYLEENFAAQVARNGPLDENDPQLEAAAIRFRKMKFMARTLAALCHKSGLKKMIHKDRLPTAAEKDRWLHVLYSCR